MSEARRNWKSQSISYAYKLRESASGIGAIVLAFCHATPRPFPCFIDKAAIDYEGLVWTYMLRADRSVEKDVCLGHIDTMTENLRRFADALKLDDEDRKALFAEFRLWFAKDARARSEN